MGTFVEYKSAVEKSLEGGQTKVKGPELIREIRKEKGLR